MIRSHYVRVGRWLCLGGASLGASGLLGWMVGADLLTTIVPGEPPMMPNTALGLLLIGIAGSLRYREDAGRVRTTLSLLASIVVLAIGVGTLAEYAFHTNLRIDQLLVQSRAGPYRGRPSPPTALALTFLGAAVVLFDFRSNARTRPSEWLILLAALTAFTGLTGLVLGSGPLYPWHSSPVIGVALPTSVALLLTSLGLLLERPDVGTTRLVTSAGPGGVLLRRLVLPAVVAPVFLGLIAIKLSRGLGVEEISLVVAVLASTMTVMSLLLLVVTAVALNRTHEALEASRTRTRNLVEKAPDGIFVADLDGRYTDVNDAGCQILGYTREEIIGKSIIDLLPPGDVDRLWESKKRLLGGVTQVDEWILRRKDGSYVPVEVSATILADGRWQGFCRDITARKRLENELKRIENEQRFLAEAGPVLATTLDYEETLSRIAEIAVRDLADFCIVDLVDETDGVMSRLRVVSRDPSAAWACDVLQRIQIDRKRRDLVWTAFETKRPVIVPRLSSDDVDALLQREESAPDRRPIEPQSGMAIPLMARGKLLGVIAFLSATPSRIYGAEDMHVAEAIAERAALAVENARLYRAAQRAIRVRDDVLGIVAHDLRNPLGVILMQVELVRKHEPERERMTTEKIERAATRMSRLIDDLLDVARMEAGRLAIEQSHVPVAKVLTDAVEAQRPQVSSRSLELRVDLPQDLPEIWADQDRLLQVFENLIGNAVKFTEPGGYVTLGATPRDAEVIFWVGDTGSGIAAEHQPHVFDRFWQAHRAGRRGAGLGLTIVKGIVEAHGGRVWFESSPGLGTTFFFTIPTARRAEAWRSEPASHRA